MLYSTNEMDEESWDYTSTSFGFSSWGFSTPLELTKNFKDMLVSDRLKGTLRGSHNPKNAKSLGGFMAQLRERRAKKLNEVKTQGDENDK